MSLPQPKNTPTEIQPSHISGEPPCTTASFTLKEASRCHSGELYYAFGTLGQSALPFRDWNDLVLSQVAVDAWSAFARTFDPNPSFAYLAARGYTNTTEALTRYGLWERVTPDTLAPLRIFDLPLSNSPYLEQAQCDLLGYPLTFYG